MHFKTQNKQDKTAHKATTHPNSSKLAAAPVKKKCSVSQCVGYVCVRDRVMDRRWKRHSDRIARWEKKEDGTQNNLYFLALERCQ